MLPNASCATLAVKEPALFERCFASIDIPNKADHMRLFEKEVFRVGKENPDLSSAEVIQEALKSYSVKQRAALKEKQLKAVKSGQALERIQNYVTEQVKTTKTKNEALARKLVTRRDGRSIETSVEAKAKGIYSLHAAPVVYQLAQKLNSRLAGWGINKELELDVLKGLKGEKSDPLAKRISEAFTMFRDRAVKAGNEIGLLQNWGLPQAWDMYAVMGKAKTPEDVAARKAEFVQDFFERADRDAYADHTGKVMTDEELKDYISSTFTSITTDGANKAAPKRGSSGVSKMMAAERQLFIKDAEGFQFLNDKYGAKSVLELVNGHFDSMSKLIAFTEEFGPNGDKVLEKVLSDNTAEAAKAGGSHTKEARMQRLVMGEMRGMMGMTEVADKQLARAFSAMRNLQVLKLGSASISSIADNGNILSAALFGEGSATRFYQNRIKQMTEPKASKFAAVQAGIAADVVYHNAYSSFSDMMQKGWTGAAASATNTLSFLNMLTRTRKEAFREMRLHALTDVFKSAANIGDDLNGKLLRGHGITDADYAVYRKVAQTLNDGETITPRHVMDAGHQPEAEKLAAMTIMETASGVIEQSGWGRLATARGLSEKGTWRGELIESFWMFKGYPLNAVYRMVDGYRLRGGLNGAAYTAASMVLTTAFGAIALQFSDMKSGKDPRNIEDHKFWLAALMKGGSLGVFGDFLYTKERFGKGALETAAGPLAGDVLTAASIVRGAAEAGGLVGVGESEEAIEAGKDVGGNILRLIRTNTPLLGLWYTGAAVDHAFTYQVQDLLSPGYTKRMERRSQKEFKQSWWWSPGDVTPERAPDLEAISQ